MKKILPLLILFSFMGCKPWVYYPPANERNYIKDSFYYCRDTINFHQLDASETLVQALDSIIQNVPLVSENYYWTIYLDDRSFCYTTGQLSQNNIEENFLLIEGLPCTYGAIKIKEKIVIILDPHEVFKIIREKPLIKVKNPRELKGIDNIIGDQLWSLKFNRKGKFIGIEDE